MSHIKKPIRIAHIMGKWVGGGVESVVMNYYRHMNRNQFQFDFICDGDSTNIPYDEIKSLGGKVIIVPPYQQVIRYHKELKKVLKKGNYQIVHSHINSLSLFSLCAAKGANVPIRIAHSHSTSNKVEFKRNLLKNILRPFSRIYATDYMCCSRLAGKYLFGKKTMENGDVYLLKNAIELDKFQFNKKKRNKMRRELGLNEDTFVIGHIGRFIDQKNHKFLIDIFKDVLKFIPNSKLILVGQGPLLNTIKKYKDDLGLEDSIIYLGQRKAVQDLYQAFDVFCLPSLYEGLPVVGVEAQAAGLLCFFSNTITEEVKIIHTTTFLGLNQSSKEWAEKIVEMVEDYSRINSIKECSKNGFDIVREARKLEERYLYYLSKISSSHKVFDEIRTISLDYKTINTIHNSNLSMNNIELKKLKKTYYQNVGENYILED